MTQAFKKARVEHIKYTIGGNPDGEVLKQMYRVVVMTTTMKGSRVLDLVDWVGEVNATKKDIARINRIVKKDHGIEVTNLTPSITIYSSTWGR